MSIYEIKLKGPPVETHYVLTTDPKLAKQRVRFERWPASSNIPSSSIEVREMLYNELLTLCSQYKPMTHSVDEWYFLLGDLVERKSEQPGLYLGKLSSKP